MLAMTRRRRKRTEPTDSPGPAESTEGVPEPTERATSPSPDVAPKRKRSRRRRKKKTQSPWSIEQFQVPEKPGETRFHDFDLPEPIMHAIADLGFQYCTPIQSKVLAHANAGQNISGRAQTGTGKTAAFLITIFSRFLQEPTQGERSIGSPRALVLAPTRELAIQIVKDAEDLGKYCRFNCLAIYGGLEVKKQQRRLDKRPVDLIVATPGRPSVGLPMGGPTR